MGLRHSESDRLFYQTGPGGLANKLNSAIYILLSLSALGRHYDRNFQILSKNFRPFFFLSKQNMIQYAKKGYFLIEKKKNLDPILIVYLIDH